MQCFLSPSAALLLILSLILQLQCGLAFIPTKVGGAGIYERIRHHTLKSLTSDMSDSFDILPSSMSIAELESYESSGVPLWAVIGSITAVGLTLVIPIITRKIQVARNTKANTSGLLGVDEKEAYEKFYNNKGGSSPGGSSDKL